MPSPECEHNRRKSQCRECCGSSFCEHNRRKSQCRDCGGSSFCEHNRQKSKCKDCGGSSFCIHDKQKSQCRNCNEAGYFRGLVSASIRKALKSNGQIKAQRSLDYIGLASGAEIWIHLQKQPSYEPWMTLETLGKVQVGPDAVRKWNIDHIVPLKYPGSGPEGAITDEDLAVRLHYTNLQPLCAVQNIAKGNKRVGI